MATDNKTLGRFILDGIPPAPRGIPQVEVIFDIDANGILNVSAKDKATNRSQTIRIEASTQLSKDEVERLKQEAVTHAEEDKRKKELVEAKNIAEQAIYGAEKAIVESGDKISQEIKDAVNVKIAELKSVKDGQDIETIKSKTAELSTELQKIGAAMYNKQDDGQQQQQNN
jgi:molecular chaperone DnaK